MRDEYKQQETRSLIETEMDFIQANLEKQRALIRELQDRLLQSVLIPQDDTGTEIEPVDEPPVGSELGRRLRQVRREIQGQSGELNSMLHRLEV